MRLLKRNTKTFRNMKLFTKLFLGSLVLVVMIGLAGGTGVFFIGQIQDKVEILTDIASPLAGISGELIGELQKAHTTTLGMLRSNDTSEIEEQAAVLKKIDDSLLKKSQRLADIIADAKIELNVEAVVERQRKFFERAESATASHLNSVLAEAEARQSIKQFEKQRQDLDTLLREFYNRSASLMNEKEDKSKTLIQSGDASIQDLGNLIEEMFERDYPLMKGASKLGGYLVQLQEIARAYLAEMDATRLPTISDKFALNVKRAESQLKKIRRRVATEKDKQIVKKLQEGFGGLRESVSKKGGLFPVHREYLTSNASVERLQAQLVSETRAYRQVLQEILQISHDLSVKAQQTVNQKVAHSLMDVGIVVCLGIFGGLVGTLLIARSITRPINSVVNHLRDSARQVASVSVQASSSSRQLAEASSEQAASLEETSSSLEEMGAMTKQNAENAKMSDNLMKEANQIVSRANDSMSKLTASMQEISQASEETSKIIKTIDEIAFQTNLLALNAAVEAARAGEAGAGFAVVADEVRNLAMRAADAAKSTAELIEDTTKKVTEGSDLVAGTNDEFSNVAATTVKVGDLVNEIAAASDEQARGFDQINRAVADMDKVVQQTAANAEESSGVSEDMNVQAGQMKRYVEQLVALVGGRSRTKNVEKIQPTKGSQKRIPKIEVVGESERIKPDQDVPPNDVDLKGSSSNAIHE